MGLRGEYIWDGTYLMGADTDVDDMGHETRILESISHEYGENLLEELQEILSQLNSIPDDQLESNPLFRKIDDATIEIDEIESIVNKLQRSIYSEILDSTEIATAFDIVKTVYPESYSDPRDQDAIKALNRDLDPRIFGMKYYDYVLIRNNNFDVWGWNQSRAKSIMSAIHELVGEELGDPKSELWDKTITVNDFSVPKSKPYVMTIRELDENPLIISKAPVVTSKDERTPYIDPTTRGSTQSWQQRYTSESFSNFLKHRDPVLFESLKHT